MRTGGDEQRAAIEISKMAACRSEIRADERRGRRAHRNSRNTSSRLYDAGSGQLGSNGVCEHERDDSANAIVEPSILRIVHQTVDSNMECRICDWRLGKGGAERTKRSGNPPFESSAG
jgi:hypothetical protein